MRFLALILIGFLFSLAVAAQQEVGKARVNGRTVSLKDDGTWSYIETETGDSGSLCDGKSNFNSEKIELRFCLAQKDWTRANVAPYAEHQFRLVDSTVVFVTITERISITEDGLRKAILQYAQNAAGLAEVNVLEDGVTSSNPWSPNYIVYTTMVNGLSVTLRNYYRSQNGETSQLLFWTAAGNEKKLTEVAEEVMRTVEYE